jgi:hypothetical protein
MRALAFEKEPTFKAMEATSIWGTLISAGASLAGGAFASKSSKNAAGTAAAGDQAALQAQQEAYDNSRGTLQPYVNRGNKGQAYLDALTYGRGTYTDAPVYGSSPAENLDATLKQQNPGAWATWQGWESKLKPGSYTKGHRGVYGDFQGFLKATDPTALQRAQDALNAGTASGGAASGDVITRDDALENLYVQPDWQWNEEDYTTRQGMTDADYATRQGMTEADYLARQGFTDAEIAAWMASADVAEGRAVDQMFSRGGVTGMVGQTQRGVAQVGQDFARDRAQYSAGRKRGDYDIYSGRKGADYGNYSGRKVSDFNTYAGGKRSAYGSYLEALSGDADRGYQASTGQASAGQSYAANTGNIRSQGAREQAGYLKDSAEAWAGGIQGALGYGAEAWNKVKKKQPKAPAYSDAAYDYAPPGWDF